MLTEDLVEDDTTVPAPHPDVHLNMFLESKFDRRTRKYDTSDIARLVNELNKGEPFDIAWQSDTCKGCGTISDSRIDTTECYVHGGETPHGDSEPFHPGDKIWRHDPGAVVDYRTGAKIGALFTLGLALLDGKYWSVR